MALQKFPLQIRLDVDELEALDQYVARFADFPPSRVQVVHRALREWLSQKLTVPPAGPAVPSALETGARDPGLVRSPADPTPPDDLPPDVHEELPPMPREAPPALLPASDAEGSPRPIVTSDEDAHSKPERRSPVRRKGRRT
jgi:hypothetical protein